MIHTCNKVRPISMHLCIHTRTDVFARVHVVHESWERTSMHHLTRRGVSGYHPETEFLSDGISGRGFRNQMVLARYDVLSFLTSEKLD